MQTPGKATRRRSPRCTVNPLLNTLLPLHCPPTHRACMAAPFPTRFCPRQLTVLSATAQYLPSSSTLQFPCFMAPEIKKAITTSNKGSTLQQWGLPVSWQVLLLQPSLCSPVQPTSVSLALWGLGCLCVARQTFISVMERATGRDQEHAEVWHAAPVPLARQGANAAPELFRLWFLLHLTHTSRVFLLLFIHREIARP